MPALASRLARIRVPPGIALATRARELAASGLHVISLTVGEPDFASPAHAVAAAHEAAQRGETKYPPQDGTPALKAAIRRKFARDQGIDYAAGEVMVGNGGKQVIFDALLAMLDPGDEVVIPAPYWVAYPLMTELAGGTPVFVACPQNNQFRPRAEDIEAAISARTKAIILNFPNNPTGATLAEADLDAIASVLRRHPALWIVADEIYEHLVHDGRGHVSLASLAPDLRDRIVTVSGVSKTYAMTGWRIGFAAGPAPLIRAMVNMQGQVTAGVSSVGQAAAAAALDGPQESVFAMCEAYRRRRGLVVAALNKVPGLSCHTPGGAFYVFPSVAGVIGKRSPGGRRIEDDGDFTEALLEEAHVAVAPGASFGMSPYIRISYATGDEQLVEACRRIESFVRSLA